MSAGKSTPIEHELHERRHVPYGLVALRPGKRADVTGENSKKNGKERTAENSRELRRHGKTKIENQAALATTI